MIIVMKPESREADSEVHDNPAEALSDGPQSIKPTKFLQLMTELKPLAQVLGRTQ